MEVKKEKIFSVGVIGAGEIVTKVHLPVLLSHKKVFIKWITDIDLTKGKLVAQAYGIRYIETPCELVTLPPVDIILLAIPYGARIKYYETFKNSHVAFYIEKPFAKTLEEHKLYCSWFEPYKLACGFQRRSWGPTQTIKAIIENHTFGVLKAIKFGLGNPASFVNLASFFSDIKHAGAGILFDVGIHGIDTMFYCTNPKSVYLRSSTMILCGGFDIHTTADFVLESENGSKIECNIIVSSIKYTSNKMEFIFDNVVLSYSLFDLEGRITVIPRDKTKRSLLDIVSKEYVYPLTTFQTFYKHWGYFLEGIETKKINLTSAIKYQHTIELIDEIYKNSEKVYVT